MSVEKKKATATEPTTCMSYLVRGYMASRGPIEKNCQDALDNGTLGCLGKTYPAGPVWFVRTKAGMPATNIKRQYHAERLLAVSSQEILAEIHKVAPQAQLLNFFDNLPKEVEASNPLYQNVEKRCGYWRLTECDDDYPAHIDLGSIIHTPSQTEWWKFPEHFKSDGSDGGNVISSSQTTESAASSQPTTSSSSSSSSAASSTKHAT
jgi:hypothetical protein